MKKLFLALLTLLSITPAVAQSNFGSQVIQVRPPGTGGPTVDDFTQYLLSKSPVGGLTTASFRQGTSRVAISNQVSGSNIQSGWRVWQSAYDAFSAISICHWNGFVASNSGEAGTGSAGLFRQALEYPPYSGRFIELTSNGGVGINIANNAIACTDVTQLGVTIPAGAKFRLSGDVLLSGAGRAPASGWSNACDRANGDEYQSGAAGYGHYKDDTVLGTGSAQCYYPALVLIYTNKSVQWLIGDSIAAGVNDQSGDPSGGKGALGIAMARIGPSLNYGVPGDRASLYQSTANSAARTALAALGGASTAYLELGVNDLFSGARTVDQLLTDRATIVANAKAAIPGINVYYTTVTPSTTSSDGWATTGNQATSGTSGNNNRAAFNDFERGVVSYTVTCTETTSSATLTACVGLPVTTIAPGMNATGTGISTSTPVTAINTVAGTVTLATAGNVTGSGAQSITFAWPATSTTFPTVNAGVIDFAKMVEGSPNQAFGPVVNGGVGLPGYYGQTDGLHLNFYGISQAVPLLQSQMQTLR